MISSSFVLITNNVVNNSTTGIICRQSIRSYKNKMAIMTMMISNLFFIQMMYGYNIPTTTTKKVAFVRHNHHSVFHRTTSPISTVRATLLASSTTDSMISSSLLEQQQQEQFQMTNVTSNATTSSTLSLLSFMNNVGKDLDNDDDTFDNNNLRNDQKYQMILQLAKDKTTNQSSTSTYSMKDLQSTMGDIYDTLESNSIYDTSISPTIRFSYVTPPVFDTNDRKPYTTWNNRDIQSMNIYNDLPYELQPYFVQQQQQKQDNVSNKIIKKKPIIIYLPGLDGYGISSCTNQWDDLSNTFEMYRCLITRNDRTSFSQLITSITQYIQNTFINNNNEDQQQSILLMGESCGGLIASAVSIQLMSKYNNNSKPNWFNGLVLINPATSFDKTIWDQLIPLLLLTKYIPNDNNNTITPYSFLGSMILSLIVPDTQQLQNILQLMLQSDEIQKVISSPLSLLSTSSTSQNDAPNPLTTLYNNFANSLNVLEYRLSPGILEHRVMNWLHVGIDIVNERLYRLQTIPILMIVGENDLLLPSNNEASTIFLQKLNNNGNSRIKKYQFESLKVPLRGHFVLDDSVNVTEAIIYSKYIDPLLKRQKIKKYNPITDWILPNNINEYIQNNIHPIRDAFSPIYISTDSITKKRVKGLSKIPSRSSINGPILFVGNHQFLAMDMAFYVSELYQQRNLIIRALAHPITFASLQRPFDSEFRDGRKPGLNNKVNSNNNIMGGLGMMSYDKVGAVIVSPKNYYELLKSGQNVLLFPGGADETLCNDPSYPLFWPKDKMDFVRTAARFNATIIPFSAIGMVESFQTIVDAKTTGQIATNLQSVFKQQQQKQQQQRSNDNNDDDDNTDDDIDEERRYRNMTMNRSARYDRKKEDEMNISFPLSLPSIPQRNYIMFGQPIDTTTIDHNDKTKCYDIYQSAYNEVQNGIKDLLHVRQFDEYYKNPLRRLLYERIYGKQAPTFPIDLLNSINDNK